MEFLLCPQPVFFRGSVLRAACFPIGMCELRDLFALGNRFNNHFDGNRFAFHCFGFFDGRDLRRGLYVSPPPDDRDSAAFG